MSSDIFKYKNVRVSSEFKRVVMSLLQKREGIQISETQIPDTVEGITKLLADAGYIATLEIAMSLFISIVEYKPLLLEGPPGSGKTFLAQTVAKAKHLPLYRIQCHEGMTFGQIMGHWDFQKQVLAMKGKGGKDVNIYSLEFFKKGPLLEAVTSGEDGILLVDEFDKTDQPTEAEFLEYLGERSISIPHLKTIKQVSESELQELSQVSPHKNIHYVKNKTFVFITSNMIRSFSDALRRRCIYLFIDYPDIETETRILQANIKNIEINLARQIAYLLQILREKPLEHSPSTEEGISFARTLIRLNITTITEDTLEKLYSHLTKTKEDIIYIKKNKAEIIKELHTILQKETFVPEVPEVQGEMIEEKKEVETYKKEEEKTIRKEVDEFFGQYE